MLSGEWADFAAFGLQDFGERGVGGGEPILFARHSLSIGQIGVLAAFYPAVWGAGQLATGALSDIVGRKWLIAAGMAWLPA